MIRLLKHPKSNDIAMEVLKKFYVKEKDVWKIRVRWWNIGPHEPFCMWIEEKIQLPTEKFMEWRPMQELRTERRPEGLGMNGERKN